MKLRLAAMATLLATAATAADLPVKDTELHAKVAAALDALIADGTYKVLLAKWKPSGNTVEKATINGGQ